MLIDRAELSRMAVIGLTVVLAGFATGQWAWCVALGLAVWVGYHAVEFLRFMRWAKRPLSRPEQLTKLWQKPVMRLARSLRSSRVRSRGLVRELRRLRVTTQALPDGVVLIRRSNEIEAFNQAAELLLGLSLGDVGRNLVSLVRHPTFASLAGGKVSENLIELTSPLDEELRLEIRRIEVDAQHVLIVARDVTRLNRLLTMRQDFVANVSHELRTPLTVILGYLETLDDPDLDIETLRVMLGRMTLPARRMKALVDDLLLLTRLESSPAPTRGDLAPIDVEAMLRSVVAEARALSSGTHDICLEAETGLRVRGVEQELLSAFSNLVANAVRYSPGGGHITVRWFESPCGPTFEVEDEGLGIAPEHLSRITERFYRVDFSDSPVRGGTGLGLAIVKHVLKRHGTTLMVESEVGKGSRFYCVFAEASRETTCLSNKPANPTMGIKS